MMEYFEIGGSNETLLDQAPATASHYMTEAQLQIDRQFGQGFAAAHPELIVGFMQTCAADFAASVTARTISQLSDRLGDALTGLRSS